MHKKQNLCEMYNKRKVPNKILLMKIKLLHIGKTYEIKKGNYKF